MVNKLKKIIELYYPDANEDQTRNIVSDLQMDIERLYYEAENSYFKTREKPDEIRNFLIYFKLTLNKELLRSKFKE